MSKNQENAIFLVYEHFVPEKELFVPKKGKKNMHLISIIY